MVIWLQTVSIIVTALATGALVYVTWVLAKVTRQMHNAATSPNIIVTVRASRWSAIHLNQHLVNVGSGPAFDVRVDIKVRRPDGSVEDLPKKTWREISILAPNQELTSFMGSTAELLGVGFEVQLTWALQPNTKNTHRKSYFIDTSSWAKTTLELGGDPQVQIAQEIKKIREDLHRVLSGSERLAVNNFSQEDRDVEADKLKIWVEERRQASSAQEASEK